jgi:hypothetical protein
MVDFCKRKDKPLVFLRRVEEFNKLLYLWGMKRLGATDEQIVKADVSTQMARNLNAYAEYVKQATDENGIFDPTKSEVPSPISKKSLLKKLQECFEAVPTVSTMTATANILGGIQLTYTGKGKNPEDIRLMTDSAFMEIFQNACHVAVTSKSFAFVGVMTIEEYEAAKKKAEEKAAKEKAEKDAAKSEESTDAPAEESAEDKPKKGKAKSKAK